ncbi:MAG: GNAT family N-acetyltransferase [Streptosporangiaceae bacterium]
MGTYLFVLRQATPGDLDVIRQLAREASTWLRTKGTDQWATPWPDQVGQQERMLADLLKGKTWIVWDGAVPAATITIDTDEPLDLNDQPIWPPRKRRKTAIYVRRVIVSRRYGGIRLGTALLDWAAEMAKTDHRAALLRIDAWTTNSILHRYYKQQKFRRRKSRPAGEILNYPSQALFERRVRVRISDYKRLFTEESDRL